MSEITSLINKVRDKQPLVHNITNQVVINYTANGLYAIGAAPVMANAVEEAADMANNANALLLNIGTLTTVQVDAMILAGKAANKKTSSVRSSRCWCNTVSFGYRKFSTTCG